MADHATTTHTPLPVSPRPLVIPHVLTPEELAGLLRVGTALADIQDRLAAVMGRPGGPIASELADLATLTLDLLDVVEGDPDLEPSLGYSPVAGTADLEAEDEHDEDGGDNEPSLGAAACDSRLIAMGYEVRSDLTSSQLRWGVGPRHDREDEHDGREPSLCGLGYGHGDEGDREGEHDGAEPDEDDSEPWHSPPRLDVFAEPFRASLDGLTPPLTEELLWSYMEWLQMEARFLCWEQGPRTQEHFDVNVGHALRFRSDNPSGRYHANGAPLPSTRAAVVLSAVGCDWPTS